MDILSIIGIIIFIALAVLILKLIKSTIKAVMLISSVLTVILIIGVFFVYSDANDFKENFPSVPSLYLLQKDDEIIAGFYGIFSGTTTPSLIGEEQLISYQNNFKENNLSQIRGDYYKIFILKSEVFDSLAEIRTEEDVFSKETIFSFLESDTPVNDYLKFKNAPIGSRDDLLNSLNIRDDTEFKAVLFTVLFGALMEDQGSFVIFTQYKKENIIIYPETTLFRLIKIIPLSLLDKVVKISPGE